MLSIDHDSKTPTYQQIIDAVLTGLKEGTINPGERLATVRGLAIQLDLAANTVAHAYREMEKRGIIETKGRLGTFVTGGENRHYPQALSLASEYVSRMGSLGYTPAQAGEIASRVGP